MKPTDGRRMAIVVFVDHTECRWLTVLKRGFRHCFVAIRQGPSWIVCDPLKNRIELLSLDLSPDFDLAGFYAAQGHAVLVGAAADQQTTSAVPPTPLTCVAVVKRIIGVRAAAVLTPRQLFLHLARGPGAGPSWRWVRANGSSASADPGATSPLDM